MSCRCVALPISLRLSSRSSAKMSLRNSSMAVPSGAGAPARGGEHGIDDRLIAGASADIPGNRLDHISSARRGIAIEQRLRRHQHTRRAVTALGCKIVGKSALERVEIGAVLQSVKRLDGASGYCLGKRQAGKMQLAVDQHAAGAATTL